MYKFKIVITKCMDRSSPMKHVLITSVCSAFDMKFGVHEKVAFHPAEVRWEHGSDVSGGFNISSQ